MYSLYYYDVLEQKETEMEINEEKKLALIKNIQAVTAQMKADDIEENPTAAEESFVCSCCGEVKTLAGTMPYIEMLFCNDCVLVTEISLALGKIKDPEEMIHAMEDKRFETLYNSIFDNNKENIPPQED